MISGGTRASVAYRSVCTTSCISWGALVSLEALQAREHCWTSECECEVEAPVVSDHCGTKSQSHPSPTQFLTVISVHISSRLAEQCHADYVAQTCSETYRSVFTPISIQQ
jgi:hypothetical protein